MKCNICKENIVLNNDSSNNIICSRNFAVKFNDTYICTACNDAQMLFLDKPKIRRKKSEKKLQVIKKEITYTCIKCKHVYKGSKCDKCNMINPLFVRKSKKKKKKKKK